ncbi:MAG: DUF58 domain-containing protein [Hominimerdicola sp.]
MKGLLSYIFCIIIALMLTYFINGSGGWLVLMLLIVAFVTSMVIYLVSRKKVRLSMKMSYDVVNKGEDFGIKLICKKNTFLPSCFVEITVETSPNISVKERTNFKFILSSSSEEIIEIPLTAKYSGAGNVRISSVKLIDYLGIAHKESLLKCMDIFSADVKIMPGIPDTGTQTEVIKSTSENMTFDDDEEESDETALGMTGVPGYEHRPYEVGDPLKRINWKMSSKRDKLMVRLDEKIASSSQVFALDYPRKLSMDETYYYNADKVIEASLAMLAILVRQGFESDYNYYLDGWQTVQVKDDKSLLYLQEQLAGIKPYPTEFRFPDKNINKKNLSFLCFTTCTAEMHNELSAILDGFNGVVVVTKFSGIGKIYANMWSVDDDFTFAKM